MKPINGYILLSIVFAFVAGILIGIGPEWVVAIRETKNFPLVVEYKDTLYKLVPLEAIP